MSRRCPNCDQHLLADETVCWQCGAQVQPESSVAPVTPTKNRAATWRSDPLIIYGAVTALVLLTTLLLTAYLGRLPLAQTQMGNPPSGWVAVSDPARQVALFLPQDWSRYTAPDEALTQVLEQHDFYDQALAPLVEYVEDEEVVLLATGARPTTFLIIARSVRLNRLSPADAAFLAGDGDDRVVDAREIAPAQGASQAAFLVELPTESAAPLQCRQRFLRGIDSAFLFSLCSSENGLQEEAAGVILSSIQRLQ